MREMLTETLWQLILEDCREQNQSVIWNKPILRFADAEDPYFEKFRELIRPDHHMPRDFLPEARTVISWFMPFLPEIEKSNRGGDRPSCEWADAYNITNAMAARVNEKFCAWIRRMPGQDAAVPFDAGMLGPEIPWSRWSHRHIGWLAGQGTFGMNNMLISDCGCVGRYFSTVTTLEIPADKPVTQERCLYKRDGSCGICMKNCPVQALSDSGFDRYRCMYRLADNKANNSAATVCGKCLAGLPCSHRNPIQNKE